MNAGPAARAWTTPEDLAAEVRRDWDRGRVLAASMTGTHMFPRTLRFHRPTSRELAARFEDVRRWIRNLEQGSKSVLGHGYELQWTDVNHRLLGRNRIP